MPDEYGYYVDNGYPGLQVPYLNPNMACDIWTTNPVGGHFVLRQSLENLSKSGKASLRQGAFGVLTEAGLLQQEAVLYVSSQRRPTIVKNL